MLPANPNPGAGSDACSTCEEAVPCGSQAGAGVPGMAAALFSGTISSRSMIRLPQPDTMILTGPAPRGFRCPPSG